MQSLGEIIFHLSRDLNTAVYLRSENNQLLLTTQQENGQSQNNKKKHSPKSTYASADLLLSTLISLTLIIRVKTSRMTRGKSQFVTSARCFICALGGASSRAHPASGARDKPTALQIRRARSCAPRCPEKKKSRIGFLKITFSLNFSLSHSILLTPACNDRHLQQRYENRQNTWINT